MKDPRQDELLKAIAANHGLPVSAKAETAAAKNVLRKKKHGDEREEEEAPRTVDEAMDIQDGRIAADEAPLQLAQADTGAGSDAAAGGAVGTDAAGRVSGSLETTAGVSGPVADPAAGDKDNDIGFGWLALGGLALGGIAVAAGGSGGAVAAPAAADNIVNGLIVAGPVLTDHGLRVNLYNADGNTLLGSGAVDAQGRYSINIGSYSGVVIAKLIDKDDAADHMDEATGTARDINGNFMAVGVVVAGTNTVNINALTTVAAQKAGLAADGSGSIANATAVTNANAATADAFGLTDLHGGNIITTVDVTGAANDAFTPAALTSAMQYGAVLAALSGVDANNDGDMQTTINGLVANLTVTDTTGTLNDTALASVMEGAALAAVTTGGSGETGLTAVVSSLTIQTTATAITINRAATDDVINIAEAGSAITGTCEAGAMVNLVIGDNTRMATVTGTTWSYTLVEADITAMGQGGDVIKATATLNGTDTTARRGVFVDTTAPANVGALAVTGGEVTSDTTPTVTGTAEAGSTVRLYDTDGTTLLGTATADGSGNWSITSTTLGEGAHTLSVTVTDPAGNTNATAGSLGVTIDTAAPANAGTLAVTGTGAGNVISDTTPTVTGTAEAGSTVRLYDTDGTTLLGTATADGSGNWSITSTTLGEGAHTLGVTVTDPAGNINASAGSLGVTIDTTAPAFSSGTSASVAENTATSVTVYDATADGDSGVTYTIGGTDGGLFDIDASTGAVTFKVSPDYEIPTDSGPNNIYDFTVTATDAAGNATGRDVALTVTDEAEGTYTLGQPVIDLGDYGKLIAPVYVDGKWFYFWDMNGDGVHNWSEDASGKFAYDGSVANADGSGYQYDFAPHDVLDGLFTEDVNGGTPGGGGNTTDTYRYTTLEGVRVALPTANGGAVYPGGIDGYQPGTAIDNDPVGEANPDYDDLLAIWDAYNGVGTGTEIYGTPSGWQAVDYWSATPSANGHASVHLYHGYVGDYNDYNSIYVALQVL